MRPVIRTFGDSSMSHFIGLDVSQKSTAICVVDKDGRRIWRGQCLSVPEDIGAAVYTGRLRRMDVEELAPHMRPASHLDALARCAELVEVGIAVGLQGAAEVLEMPARERQAAHARSSGAADARAGWARSP
jgi:hypothetical protein